MSKGTTKGIQCSEISTVVYRFINKHVSECFVEADVPVSVVFPLSDTWECKEFNVCNESDHQHEFKHSKECVKALEETSS